MRRNRSKGGQRRAEEGEGKRKGRTREGQTVVVKVFLAVVVNKLAVVASVTIDVIVRVILVRVWDSVTVVRRSGHAIAVAIRGTANASSALTTDAHEELERRGTTSRDSAEQEGDALGVQLLVRRRNSLRREGKEEVRTISARRRGGGGGRRRRATRFDEHVQGFVEDDGLRGSSGADVLDGDRDKEASVLGREAVKLARDAQLCAKRLDLSDPLADTVLDALDVLSDGNNLLRLDQSAVLDLCFGLVAQQPEPCLAIFFFFCQDGWMDGEKGRIDRQRGDMTSKKEERKMKRRTRVSRRKKKKKKG